MVHPEPSRIRAVCRVLAKMYPYESREGCGVDMTEERVSVRGFEVKLFGPSTWFNYAGKSGHKCGTVHCFAGWYFLAQYWELWDIKKDYLRKDVYYERGVDALNEHLGGPDFRFEEWAMNFEGLWGNEYGGSLFHSRCAFGVEKGEEITLKKIVTHLEGVADRIEADRKEKELKK